MSNTFPMETKISIEGGDPESAIPLVQNEDSKEESKNSFKYEEVDLVIKCSSDSQRKDLIRYFQSKDAIVEECKEEENKTDNKDDEIQAASKTGNSPKKSIFCCFKKNGRKDSEGEIAPVFLLIKVNDSAVRNYCEKKKIKFSIPREIYKEHGVKSENFPYWAEYSEKREDDFKMFGENLKFPKWLKIIVAYHIYQKYQPKVGQNEKEEQDISDMKAFPPHWPNGEELEKYFEAWTTFNCIPKLNCKNNQNKSKDEHEDNDEDEYKDKDKNKILTKVKDYFGVKISLYFHWMKFYNYMLFIASFLGIVTMIYGAITLPTHPLTNDICNTTADYVMCPLCDGACGLWNLSSSCSKAKITHLFDNNINIAYTILMTLWSVALINIWERRSSTILYKLGICNFNNLEDHIVQLSESKKLEKAQNKNLTKTARWSLRVVSFGTVFLVASLIMCAVLGVVFYRMARAKAVGLFKHAGANELNINITAGIMNLSFIVISGYFYKKLAYQLTKKECFKTQVEFEKSLNVKLYLFQFVNYYSSILYIAFLKGKFIGAPNNYIRIFGYRQEECNQGGCYQEIFMQLIIIMVGKQLGSTIMQYLKPLSKKLYKRYKKDKTNNEKPESVYDYCVQDSLLLTYEDENIQGEYLEIVLQYGFVVLFVNAFPLAPLFAYLNNIIEKRVDAKKLVSLFQRPIPHRARSIGVWISIMDIIGRISVFSNAIMIAFSSKYIPYMVYHYASNRVNVTTFLNFTLSSFNLTHINDITNYAAIEFNNTDLLAAIQNGDKCYYRDYRYPYYDKDSDRYRHTKRYWTILYYRLLFVILFQVSTSVIRILLQWLIPKIPRRVREHTRVNNQLIEQIIEKKSNKVQST